MSKVIRNRLWQGSAVGVAIATLALVFSATSSGVAEASQQNACPPPPTTTTTTAPTTTTTSTTTTTTAPTTTTTSTTTTTTTTIVMATAESADSPVNQQAALSTHCVGIVTGLGPGGPPHVRIANPNNLNSDLSNFDTVDPATYSGGMYVASADITGDGNADVVAGQLGVVKFRDAGGQAIAQDVTPYGSSFKGEIRVAAADLDGDGKAEVITAPGPGGGPHLRAFKLNGTDMVPVAGVLGDGIFAYAANFTGGVYVAAADLAGDSKAEIVTGAGPGGGPHVRVFNPDGTKMAGQIGEGFFAYGAEFHGGVRVAAGSFSGTPLIITGAGPGGGPHVREFGMNAEPVAGQPGSGWYAYGPQFHGGVFVAVGDIDTDNETEIITGAGSGGGPHVRAFKQDISPVPGQVGSGYMATTPSFGGGVTVAAAKV